MISKRIPGMLLLLIALATLAFGQTSTGEVNGTLTDPAGAAVPGAAVKLINQATQVESRTVPNADGYFTFVNVRPGTYMLRIEAQGFKTAQIVPIQVGVSQTVTQNVTLTVGEVYTDSGSDGRCRPD